MGGFIFRLLLILNFLAFIPGLYAQEIIESTESKDSVIFDTVIIVKEPIIIKREIYIEEELPPLPIFISLTPFVDFNYKVNSFKAVGNHLASFESSLKNATKSKMGYRFGLTGRIHYKNWFLGSGVHFGSSSNKFHFFRPFYQIDSTLISTLDTLDTYFVVNNSDTTWHYITQEVQMFQNDTLDLSSTHDTINHFRYIEIPLTAGYNITLDKLQLKLYAGLIAGFLVSGNSSTISSISYEVYENEHNQLVWSGLAGLEIDYQVSSRIKPSLGLVYRQTINGLHPNTPYLYNAKCLSMQLGVSFTL